LKLDTTIENHVHTHVKGGGGSAFTIERALLLLISTFIHISKGGDAIVTTHKHIHTHIIEREKREWATFLLLKQRKRGGTKLNMNMFFFIHKI
jgi:hypothetical protein